MLAACANPHVAAVQLEPLAPRTPIAFSSNRDGDYEIYVMEADGGNVRRLTYARGTDSEPAWSPDGTNIAFSSNRDGDFEIFIMDADGGNVRQLTDAPGRNEEPTWSPDGTRIAFTSVRDGHFGIFSAEADGGNVRPLTDALRFARHPAWSPDGTQIAFQGNIVFLDRGGILVMDANGGSVRRPRGPWWGLLTDDLGRLTSLDAKPAWSPDGTQIVFQGLRGRHFDIYVMDADGGNVRQLTDDPKVDGAPAWSPDGTQIAFECTSRCTGEGLVFNEGMFVMDADGGNARQLTDASVTDTDPAWSPVP